jgi:hypothetical protein
LVSNDAQKYRLAKKFLNPLAPYFFFPRFGGTRVGKLSRRKFAIFFAKKLEMIQRDNDQRMRNFSSGNEGRNFRNRNQPR